MKKRINITIAALIIAFIGIIAFNFIKSFMIKRFFSTYIPPAVSVSSVTAKQKNWEPRISAVGNFIAINGVDVNSQAAGNVMSIHFQSGQYIKENDPLIDIDDSIDLAILKSSQSELALQEINYKRLTDLAKRGATSSSSVDEARAKLLQAQAQVEKNQATIHQKHINAPFSGKLGIRNVNLGQYITPGQTGIVTLQSMDPLYLQFHLPEQLLDRLHLNQGVIFSVEQNPNLLFKGQITAINSKIDVNTHNIEIQATLPNCPSSEMKNPSHSSLINVLKKTSDGKTIISCDTALNTKNRITNFNFIPGMFAAIDIEQPIIPNVIVLPTTAISYSLYGDSVYIIEKDNANKDILVVKRVFVSTGEQQGNYTVIKEGVKAGQLVVAAGELKLQNGTRVTINNSVRLEDVEHPDQLGD